MNTLDLHTQTGPVVVTLAYVGLYYGFQLNIMRVKTRLRKEYDARGEKFDRYFSQDRAMLAADRFQLNMLEHMGPFLVLLWLNAVFVSPTIAAVFGAVYLGARCLYPFAMGDHVGRSPRTLILAATVPGYLVLAGLSASLIWGLLVPPAMAAAPTDEAWTPAKLVDRVAAARGGKAKLAAIQSVRFTGTGQSGGFKMAMRTVVARPGLVRDENTIQGLTQVTAWDGQTGWTINPFSGRRTADRMDPEDAKALVLEAELEGPLLGAAGKGLPMTSLGTVDVEGSPAYLVRIERPAGDVQDVYIDPDSFLEIKVVTRMMVHGVMSESEAAFGDYEPIEGVLFPLEVAYGAKNHAQEGFRVSWTKVELQVSAPATLFRMPEAK